MTVDKPTKPTAKLTITGKSLVSNPYITHKIVPMKKTKSTDRLKSFELFLFHILCACKNQLKLISVPKRDVSQSIISTNSIFYKNILWKFIKIWSATSSLFIPFISAIFLMVSATFAGSFVSPGSGPK